MICIQLVKRTNSICYNSARRNCWKGSGLFYCQTSDLKIKNGIPVGRNVTPHSWEGGSNYWKQTLKACPYLDYWILGPLKKGFPLQSVRGLCLLMRRDNRYQSYRIPLHRDSMLKNHHSILLDLTLYYPILDPLRSNAWMTRILLLQLTTESKQWYGLLFYT